MKKVVAACLVLLAGCGAKSNKGTAIDSDLDAAIGVDSGGGGDSAGGSDAGFVSDVPAVGNGDAAIYGHSETTLYKLDPNSLSVTVVGDFVTDGGDDPGQMTDIALDKAGVMYGVTYDYLFRIDYKAAQPTCTQLASLSTEFNGLTFVPEGMIDAANEVLIGVALDGGWWRVDTTPASASAKLTKLGSYGGGWQSSGDAVGIIGDAVYATVNTGLGSIDHVVTVNPKTGAVLKDIGSTGVSGLFGVGYWGGVMYGFASSGSLFKIDLSTAIVTSVPISNAPNEWWGAGVTTSAPTIAK